MCGQLGFSGVDNFDIEKIKILALWNSLARGLDSTGFYSPNNGLITTLKGGSQLLGDNSLINNLTPDNVLMGHFRYATIGSKTILKNAHPFERGDYLLQHNGTIKNYIDLRTKYSLPYYNFDVDSDIICGAIEKCGNISQVLSEINGPGAIIIHNKKEPTKLYIFRNDERPLFKGFIGQNMYISSIEESLSFIGCINIKEFKKDMLYIIENGLILGDPIKIINKPYYALYVNNNYTVKSEDYSKNCWVRSRYNVSFNGPKKDIFNIVKGDYYLIEECRHNIYTVYCSTQDKRFPVNMSNFNNDDILVDGDYGKALVDLTVNNNLVVKKDEIIRVRTSWRDGECTIESISNSFIGIRNKSLFVKLTSDELINMNLVKEEPEIDFNVPNVDEQEEREEEDDEEYYDTMINSKDLYDYFTGFEKRLMYLSEKLKKSGAQPEILDLITLLVKYNLKGLEKFVILESETDGVENQTE